MKHSEFTDFVRTSLISKMTSENQENHFDPKVVKNLGFCQIICGLVIFATEILNILVVGSCWIPGTGIWASILFFISSGFNILVAENSSLKTSILIMNTISATGLPNTSSVFLFDYFKYIFFLQKI